MITQIELKRIMGYDPETGKFTYRIFRGSRALPGQAVGTPSRYPQVEIHGRLYRLHRIAWLWMTGEWPAFCIDHINGNKQDNRWNNLRLASKSTNGFNRPAPSNNKSGHKGVSFDKARNQWRACLDVMGKQIHVGRYKSKQEAAAAIQIKRIQLHGEFAHH